MFAQTQDLEFGQGQSRDVPDRELGPNITTLPPWPPNRPFGHIEKNIIVNVKEGTFSRMVFSISRLEGSHQAGFIKVSM